MRAVAAGALLPLALALVFTACDPAERAESPMRSDAVSATRIVIVSDLEGVLEPCGCGDRPEGGVDRLVFAMDALRAQAGRTFVVVAGETYFDARVQSESEASDDVWKAQALSDALVRIAPDVLMPGAIDRERGASRLRELAVRLPKLRVADRGPPVEIEGVTLALASSDARAHVTIETQTHADPEVQQAEGRVTVRAGQHGEGLVVLDVAQGALVRGEYRALDAKAPRDPATRRALTALFARINALHRELAARDPEASDYVGSEACASCHTQTFYAWGGTAHARAFAALVLRGRELDLACVGCHVTGEARTVSQLAGLEHRKGVGCESCHGPGSAHADNPRVRIARGSPAIVHDPSQAVCVRCHDGEHGRAFDYAQRRAALIAPGHGLPTRR